MRQCLIQHMPRLQLGLLQLALLLGIVGFAPSAAQASAVAAMPEQAANQVTLRLIGWPAAEAQQVSALRQGASNVLLVPPQQTLPALKRVWVRDQKGRPLWLNVALLGAGTTYRALDWQARGADVLVEIPTERDQVWVMEREVEVKR